jgi:hypothetical protein
MLQDSVLGAAFLPNVLCEVCGNAPARRDDLLCSDCSYAYKVLAELLERHPDLTKEAFDRLKEIYEWRTKKIQVIT